MSPWPHGLRTALTASRAHDLLAEHGGTPRWRWSHPWRSWQLRRLCAACLEPRPCRQVRWARQMLEETTMGLVGWEDLYPGFTRAQQAAAGNSGPGGKPADEVLDRCLICGRVIEWDDEGWHHLWPGVDHEPEPTDCY